MTSRMIVQQGGSYDRWVDDTNVILAGRLQDWVLGRQCMYDEHSWTAFRLDGKWDVFEGTLGITDKTSECHTGGRVTGSFAIFLDGRQVLKTSRMLPGQHQPFRLSVKGVKTMQLVIEEYGMRAYGVTAGVFAEPKLSRETP